MFTGIIEETGRVRSFDELPEGWRLTVEAPELLNDLNLGDSVAVNGCCLTASVIDPDGGVIGFDLLEETLRRTSFRSLGPGNRVNLERSLLPTTRMGGHFVSGHVDATGTIEVLENRGKDIYLQISYPDEFRKYVVWKGSIALEGISLTVAEDEGNRLAVWIIPHTWELTNLKDRQAKDPVNLEFDLLAKYLEKQQGLTEG